MQSNPFATLKLFMFDYLMSEIRPIDIWDIEIVCGEYGCVKKVAVDKRGKRQKEAIVKIRKNTGEEVASRQFRRKLSNYCSIGIDARIGLGFDKLRSKNRFLNKIFYAWDGIKKFLKPSLSMTSVIEKMELIVEYENLNDNRSNVDELARPNQLVAHQAAPDMPQDKPISPYAVNPKVRQLQDGEEERVINGFRLVTRGVF